MGRYLNVHEALKILNDHYVTDSIKMVTRWIREGKIPAERTENRKEGWRIEEGDLFDFITNYNPGIVQYIDNYRLHNDIVPIGEIEKNEDISSGNNIKMTKTDPRIREAENYDQLKEIRELNKQTDFVRSHIEEDTKAIDKDKQIQGLKQQLNEVKESVKLIIREEIRAAMDEMKENINKPSVDSEKTNEENKKGTEKREIKYKITFKDFRKSCSDVLTKDELTVYEQEIKNYYDELVEDNRVKKIHISEDGIIYCPFDKEKKIKHSYPRAIIKEGIRNYINLLAVDGVESKPLDGIPQPDVNSTSEFY